LDKHFYTKKNVHRISRKYSFTGSGFKSFSSAVIQELTKLRRAATRYLSHSVHKIYKNFEVDDSAEKDLYKQWKEMNLADANSLAAQFDNSEWKNYLDAQNPLDAWSTWKTSSPDLDDKFLLIQFLLLISSHSSFIKLSSLESRSCTQTNEMIMSKMSFTMPCFFVQLELNGSVFLMKECCQKSLSKFICSLFICGTN